MSLAVAAGALSVPAIALAAVAGPSVRTQASAATVGGGRMRADILNRTRITTRLSASLVMTGQKVRDSARLSGATTTAGGTVDYRYYPTLAACVTDALAFPTPPTGGTDVGSVTVTAGVVPDSAIVTTTAAGRYYWAAFYSGDTHNLPAVSDCRAEVLTVVEHPKIVTKVSVRGAFFTDTATLTGTGGTVTGTVDFYLCAQVGLFTGCPPVLGVPIPPTKILIHGSATSDPAPLYLAPGIYCVGVQYRNDGRSPYLDTDYTSPIGECFTVAP